MKKLTTAVMVLAAGAAVMADTVTYTDWDPALGYNTVAAGQEALTYDSAFTLPQFDSSLGTLTKVSWYIYAEVIGSVTVVNTGAASANVEYTYGSKHITTSAPLGILSSINVASYSSPPLTLASGDSDTSPELAGSDFDTGFTTSAAILANWQGAGDVTIPLRHENRILLETTGNMESLFDQYGRSYIDVTYHYDTGIVPEPGTYIGGLALLGVGGLAYRRMRRAA